MLSDETKKLLQEEMRKDAETDKKHAFGVWYPVTDPPECDMYGLVLCISGNRRGHIRYDHAIHLDSCNAYEDGKFWPSGTIDPDIEVHAWLKVPTLPEELLGDM